MFKWIGSLFSKAAKLLDVILRSVFTSAFRLLMLKLQDITTKSIVKMANTGLGNPEKKSQVFNDIKACASSKLLTVADREVNLIIEVFYNNLKNEGIIK